MRLAYKVFFDQIFRMLNDRFDEFEVGHTADIKGPILTLQVREFS
jgi:frataxin-like iron-binding protein CyaY